MDNLLAQRLFSVIEQMGTSGLNLGLLTQKKQLFAPERPDNDLRCQSAANCKKVFHMKIKLAMLAVAAGLVSACSIEPENFETKPVIVTTAAGDVTCQLYTYERVTWDRSVSRPGNMSVETADTICRNEGARIMQEGLQGLLDEGSVLRNPNRVS